MRIRTGSTFRPKCRILSHSVSSGLRGANRSGTSHFLSFSRMGFPPGRPISAFRRAWVKDVVGRVKAKNRSSWYELGRCC